MQFRKYSITLTGVTPLIMHADNIEFDDLIEKWRIDPANKKLSTKGDDRVPAWRWLGYVYTENDKIVIPSENIRALLREAGAMCPTGNKIRSGGKQNFKSQSQSGIVIDQMSWDLSIDGKEISFEPFKNLIEENNFIVHQKTAKDNGFFLYVKRAGIGSNKHVRVRPRFDSWQCSGTIIITDDQITTDVLENIFIYGGVYCGLCDWRPSEKKSPGRYGKFNSEVKLLKE